MRTPAHQRRPATEHGEEGRHEARQSSTNTMKGIPGMTRDHADSAYAAPSDSAPENGSQRTKRPRIITHNEASVDGRLSISPGVLVMSDERWPSTTSAYADVQRRHHPDVLLEGSGSLVLEGQEPAPLPEATEPASLLLSDFLPDDVRPRATRGWLTFVDSRGRIRWLYKE